MIVAFTVAVVGSLVVGFFFGYHYKRVGYLHGLHNGARMQRSFDESKRKEKL